MTRNYKVDYAKNAIILTKDFTNKANIINSEEYKILRQLKKDFPHLTISQKTAQTKEDKKTHKGLTLEYMESFIKNFDKERLTKFGEVKAYYKTAKSGHIKIKAWFIETYKSDYKEIEKSFFRASELPVLEALPVTLIETEFIM